MIKVYVGSGNGQAVMCVLQLGQALGHSLGIPLHATVPEYRFKERFGME